MAVSITQSFETGPVSLDDRQEVRVLEWEIRSTDPAEDRLLTEGDVAAKIRTGGDPFSQLPRIGDTWEAFGYTNIPVQPIAQPRDKDGELTESLRCVGGRITKIGAPGAGGTSGFHYTAQFSTRSSAWEVARNFEFSTRTKTLYIDLDAGLPEQGVSASPSWCASWTSINAQPPPVPPGHWGNEAIVRNGEGIDILEPVLTITYRQLIFSPSAADLRENIQINHLTTNANPEPPDFGTADQWLFVGATGGEIRNAIYDMTFKFLFDENNHRQFHYKTDTGSQLPLIDPITNLPVCRTYRGYNRSASWSPIMGLFTFP